MKVRLHPDVVVVGAGPVGLATAIGLTHQDKKVLILERNEHYTRPQNLQLDLNFVKDEKTKEALLRAIKEGKADKISKNSILIAIQDLEHCLKDVAERASVKIEIVKVESVKQIHTNYPDCKCIIAADGAHSTIRKDLFGDEEIAISKTALRHLIQLTYEVPGKAEKLPRLKNWNTQVSLITNGGLVCDEEVKYYPEANKSKITLNFIVPEYIYNDERLKTAIARKPLPLSKNIPPKLFHAINRWLFERGDYNFIDDTQKLNKTEIHFYRANHAYHINEENGVVTFLVGDALTGFPYRNGLIAGLEISNELARLLDKNDPEQIAKQYQDFAMRVYARRTKNILKVDTSLTAKQVGVWLYYTLAWIPINIAAAWRDVDHPMFHTGNESRYRWLWIAVGALIFAGAAAALLFTLGSLPPLAMAAIIASAAIIGAITGYRGWKGTRSHHAKESGLPAPTEDESIKSQQVTHAPRPDNQPQLQDWRRESTYDMTDYKEFTFLGDSQPITASPAPPEAPQATARYDA